MTRAELTSVQGRACCGRRVCTARSQTKVQARKRSQAAEAAGAGTHEGRRRPRGVRSRGEDVGKRLRA